MITPVYRSAFPRPHLLPRMVEAARRPKIGPPNIEPVEHDGTQPGYLAPPALVRVVNPWPAVREIRRARGLGAGEPCGFPDDLGCITQLYLGLAIRSVQPKLGMIALAEQCLVPVRDAAFFGCLLGIAERSVWVNQTSHVIAAAICEMRMRP